MAELAAHQNTHERAANNPLAMHAHEAGDRPHHNHDPNGEPVPHAEHTCLCTGSTTPGTALQIPSLEPAGVIAADDAFSASLERPALADCFAALGYADPRTSARTAPLLI